LIFSLNYTDEDFDQVMARILNAGEKMQAAGWWWHNSSLTNRSIKRQVLKETISASWFSRGSVNRVKLHKASIRASQTARALDGPRPGQ
jgi:hypothetical protein